MLERFEIEKSSRIKEISEYMLSGNLNIKTTTNINIKFIAIIFFLKMIKVIICNNTVFEEVKKYVKIAKASIKIIL